MPRAKRAGRASNPATDARAPQRVLSSARPRLAPPLGLARRSGSGRAQARGNATSRRGFGSLGVRVG